MSRSYSHLEIEEFGHHLIDTCDLDPIYLALTNVGVDAVQRRRWLVAYWCFYHAGVACYMSEREGADFWQAMMVAAENKEPTPFGERWPRGHERRHARGAQGVNMVAALAKTYGEKPEDMVEACIGPTCGEVVQKVQSHYLFGPWIGFKVADMLERVLGLKVDFEDADVFMFKDPTAAALRFWRLRQKLPENAQPRDQRKTIRSVCDYLGQVFAQKNAPPGRDRPIGLQEIETVLCKWKSHLNGHYPLFNDTIEIHEGLKPWQFVHTSKRFANAMPGLPVQGVR